MVSVALFSVLAIAVGAVGAYTILAASQATEAIRQVQEARAHLDEVEAALGQRLAWVSIDTGGADGVVNRRALPVGEVDDDSGVMMLLADLGVARHSPSGAPIVYCPLGPETLDRSDGDPLADIGVGYAVETLGGPDLGVDINDTGGASQDSYVTADDLSPVSASLDRAALVDMGIRAFVIAPGPSQDPGAIDCNNIAFNEARGTFSLAGAQLVRPLRRSGTTPARRSTARAGFVMYADDAADTCTVDPDTDPGCGFDRARPTTLQQAMAHWAEVWPPSATIHVATDAPLDPVAALSGLNPAAGAGRRASLRLLGAVADAPDLSNPGTAPVMILSSDMALPADLFVFNVNIQGTAIRIPEMTTAEFRSLKAAADLFVEEMAEMRFVDVTMSDVFGGIIPGFFQQFFDPFFETFGVANGRQPNLDLAPGARAYVAGLDISTVIVRAGAELQVTADETALARFKDIALPFVGGSGLRTHPGARAVIEATGRTSGGDLVVDIASPRLFGSTVNAEFASNGFGAALVVVSNDYLAVGTRFDAVGSGLIGVDNSFNLFNTVQCAGASEFPQVCANSSVQAGGGFLVLAGDSQLRGGAALQVFEGPQIFADSGYRAGARLGVGSGGEIATTSFGVTLDGGSHLATGPNATLGPDFTVLNGSGISLDRNTTVTGNFALEATAGPFFGAAGGGNPAQLGTNCPTLESGLGIEAALPPLADASGLYQPPESDDAWHTVATTNAITHCSAGAAVTGACLLDWVKVVADNAEDLGAVDAANRRRQALWAGCQVN